jgi:hypothetical protein
MEKRPVASKPQFQFSTRTLTGQRFVCSRYGVDRSKSGKKCPAATDARITQCVRQTLDC